MSESRNKFDIFAATDTKGVRVGQAFQNKIFTPIGGKPVAIIKNDKILDTTGKKIIGICKNGEIFKPGKVKPIGYYNQNTIFKPPPDSGKVLGNFNRSDTEDGVKVATFFLLLNKNK